MRIVAGGRRWVVTGVVLLVLSGACLPAILTVSAMPALPTAMAGDLSGETPEAAPGDDASDSEEMAPDEAVVEEPAGDSTEVEMPPAGEAAGGFDDVAPGEAVGMDDAAALGKLDTPLQLLVQGMPGPAIVVERDGVLWADVIVIASGTAADARAALVALGAQVNPSFGTSLIVTAQVPVAQLPAVAALESVQYVEASVRVRALVG